MNNLTPILPHARPPAQAPPAVHPSVTIAASANGRLLFDTSALVKRYLTERGSGLVLAICDPAAGHQILISRLTTVELLAALAKSHRMRLIDQPRLTQLTGLVLRDTRRHYQQVTMHRSLYDLAGKLALTFVVEGLRAYDAMRLACAIQANRRLLRAGQPALTLVVADAILRVAAERSGLTTLDPHSLP